MGLTLGAGVVSVIGTSRVVGALVPYVVFFVTALPIGALIAFGALLSARRPGPAAPTATRLALAGCGAVALATTWAAFRTPLEPEPASPPAGQAVTLARAALGDQDPPLMVRETNHSHWPVMAGVVLGLQRAGHDVVVDESLVPLAGESWAPDDRPRTEVIVGAPGDPIPPATGPGSAAARQLGEAAGYSVWLRAPG